MKRIDTSTKAVDLFGAGKHGYKDGDKALNIAPTQFSAASVNAIQEEIAAVIESTGVALDSGSNHQLVKAIQLGIFNVGAAGGTADAITSSFSPTIAALTNDIRLLVHAAAANATATPTFTPNSGVVTAKTIVKGHGLALAIGDISGAAHWIELMWDVTLDKWVLLNPATGVSPNRPVFHARDEKTAGTAGGTSSSGSQVRTLNTVVKNTIPGASLSSNNITLPAGTYQVRARCPQIGENPHQAFLQNVTDSATLFIGSSEDGYANGTTQSVVDGYFTLAATKVINLQHYILGGTATWGLGNASGSSLTEIYADIMIWKEQ
jgi:hypothetical protein